MTIKSKRYETGNKDGAPWIKCLKCNLTSNHHKDVEHRYCGNCHVFHDDEERIGRFYNRENQNKNSY